MKREEELTVSGWIYEDELPVSYPYDAMFPYSKVDGVRLFPVFAPASKPEGGAHEKGVEALADAIDPERSPDGGWRDQLLCEIHCDIENRGRINPDFAVTVHHRNIVLSAVSRALATLSQGSQP